MVSLWVNDRGRSVIDVEPTETASDANDANGLTSFIGNGTQMTLRKFSIIFDIEKSFSFFVVHAKSSLDGDDENGK